jgi:hypothetical protein
MKQLVGEPSKPGDKLFTLYQIAELLSAARMVARGSRSSDCGPTTVAQGGVDSCRYGNRSQLVSLKSPSSAHDAMYPIASDAEAAIGSQDSDTDWNHLITSSWHCLGAEHAVDGRWRLD